MRTPRPAPSSLLRFAPLAAALACALAAPAMAATYTVTNTLDSGPGSLRGEMQAAQNACDPAATIQFNIPAPFTIAPSSPLPTIANCLSGPVSVTLDGYSQPGASQNTLATGFNAQTPVVLDGTSFFFFGGCALTTGNFAYGEGSLAVHGLTVQNFTYGGAKGICGNVAVMGSRVLGNSYGISAYDSAAIGGAALGQRNVIAGNTTTGVFITSGTGVSITNNYVGTADGLAAAPNGDGVYVLNATDTQVSGNVISGNTWNGISVWSSAGTTISNNVIGVTALGNAALPNSDGISASCTPSMSIANNVVSGNAYGGVFLGAVATSTIKGNKVGVGADGITPVPNGGNGITVSFSDCGFNSDSNSFESNTIASNTGTGLAIASGNLNNITLNTITANGSHGVQVLVNASGNSILGNSIYGHDAGKNIDLDFAGGPLLNDLLDADIGANQRQNHPDIALVTQSGGNTLVAWSLNSEPGKAYTIEFFSNLAAGVPAGKTLIATASGTMDAAGNFSATTPPISGLWDNISATATDQATGDTSEFSAAVALTPTPEVIVAPPSLAFAGTAVGAASPPQSVTLSSVGTAPYMISAFSADSTCRGGPICSSGSFICSNSCSPSTPYAPGSSCTIDVTFAPIVVGTQSETFFICDNALGSPRPVTLTGIGTPPPSPTMTPASIDFGTVTIGAVSAIGTFTVHNTALVPAALSAFSVGAPFVLLSTTCASSMPPSSTCTADVKFAPTALGPAAGSIQVTANGLILSSGLTGVGASAAALAITPSAYDFGTVLVGSSSTQAFTVNNPSIVAAALTGPVVSGPFTISSTTCASVLNAMESCVVNVTFAPVVPGDTSGSLSATSAAGTSTASLVGTGWMQAILDMSSAPIDLGTGTLGGAALTRSVSIGNSGNAPLAIQSLSVSPPFSLTHTCPPILPPAQSCSATVSMLPVALGAFSGSLSILTDLPGGSMGVPVTARVQPRPEPVIRVLPGSIGFGERLGGSPSPAARVTVLNEGGADATGVALAIGAQHFELREHTCPAVLAPQARCHADVVFQPLGFGQKRATLRVTSNAPTAEVDLSGTGCRPPQASQGRTPRLNCAP